MSEETSSSSSLKTCEICNEKVSKYCCPRCDVFYCSLDCYKSEKHSDCSESFYRECVTNELSSLENDDESRNKMMEILKRFKENFGFNEDPFNEDMNDMGDILEDGEFDENGGETHNTVDSDDEVEIDLHERMKDVNLEDADAVWNCLTQDERNEFQALLNQGDIDSILPQWEPWWTYRKKVHKIQDLNKDQLEEEALKKCPPLLEVPKFTSLTSVPPSPKLQFNLTNVLGSYAFVMRYFNGDIDPLEAAIYLLEICASLHTTNFDSHKTALESVAQNCLQSTLIETDEQSLEVMKHDALLLLQGPSNDNKPFYCQSALSDMHTILSTAKKRTKKSGNSKNTPSEVNKDSNKNVDSKTDNSNSNSKSQEDNEDSKTESEKMAKGTFTRIFPDHKVEHLPPLDVSKVKKCIKKVEYYLAYVNCVVEAGNSVIDSE